MIILPAIDILDNKIVRLLKGDYNKVTEYPGTPAARAAEYESAGFNWVHLVDLAGSRDGKIGILDIIEEIRKTTSLNIEFGGGIRTVDDAVNLHRLGVKHIIIGSMSVKQPELFDEIIDELGPEKIVAAADVLEGKIAVKGWTEKSDRTLEYHIEKCSDSGIEKFLCTDISQDGMLKGPSLRLYKYLQDKYPGIKLFASGGIKDINDIKAVKELGMYACIAGKALYENKIDLKELAEIGK